MTDLTSFTKFRELATELQLKIWEFAALDTPSRVVSLCSSRDPAALPGPFGSTNSTRLTVYSTSEDLGILYACHASRTVALKILKPVVHPIVVQKYHNQLEIHPVRKMFINPRKDWIVMRMNQIWDIMPFFDKEACEAIRFLAISYGDPYMGPRGDFLFYVIQFTSQFPNLKSVVFLDRTTGPISIWDIDERYRQYLIGPFLHDQVKAGGDGWRTEVMTPYWQEIYQDFVTAGAAESDNPPPYHVVGMAMSSIERRRASLRYADRFPRLSLPWGYIPLHGIPTVTWVEGHQLLEEVWEVDGPRLFELIRKTHQMEAAQKSLRGIKQRATDFRPKLLNFIRKRQAEAAVVFKNIYTYSRGLFATRRQNMPSKY